MGTANTALEYHAGRLLALQEGSLPWHLRVLCDGALETVGVCTFDGAAPRTFTAHPKVDALTDELMFISYQVDKTVRTHSRYRGTLALVLTSAISILQSASRTCRMESSTPTASPRTSRLCPSASRRCCTTLPSRARTPSSGTCRWRSSPRRW
jgi:hypothetical protein